MRLHLTSKLAREILAEFIGTFILVSFAIGCIAQDTLSRGELGNSLSVSLATGMGLTLGIYWAGGVSGGSLNPAVTLALCLRGLVRWYKWPLYAMAEVAGSFFAASVQYGLYIDALRAFDSGIRSTYGVNATAGIFATYPNPNVSTLNCFFDQVFGTFILVGCILAITDKNNMAPNKGLTPIAIGGVVFAIGACFGLNCGFAINPARDLGPRIFTALAGWGVKPFSYRNYNWFWVPIVGPMVGSIVAWVVYQLFIEMHWPSTEDDDSSVIEATITLENDSPATKNKRNCVITSTRNGEVLTLGGSSHKTQL